MGRSTLSQALHNRPFQMAGARFAMQHKQVLIADEPGLGKTIQAIAAVVGNKVYGSILVIAPKTAVYVTWPAELKRWLSDIAPDDKVVVVGGKQTKVQRLREMRKILEWDMTNVPNEDDGTQPQIRQWVIISPNYLRFKIATDEHNNYLYDEAGDKIIQPVREALPSLLAIKWASVIVDEAHQTLAGATGNLKTQSAQSRGIRLLEILDDGLRLALSGTPFRGKHENLWGVLNWVRPNEYNAYWDWVKRHFDVYMDYMIGVEVVGSLRSEKALAMELRSIMIRRTKKQVLPELPEKQYGGTLLNARDPKSPIAVWLPMDGKQEKAYRDMEQQAMAELDGGTLMANSILAEITRLKQFANSHGYLTADGTFQPNFPSNKFDWILEFLEERGITGDGPGTGKVVIASQFTKHVNLFAYELREHYRVNCFVLTGETTGDQRVQMQREFQAGVTDAGNPSADVFLLNTKAGGVSLTLDAADDLILIDNTRNPDDQTQVIDRIHRISRIHNVTVWNLATKDSIDEHILEHEYLTGQSLKRILDHGGAQAARKLIGG